MENYGKTISKLRKANGFTQEELGKALNVTYQAVSKWENDLSRPDLDTITQMCRLFNISVDDFIRLANGSKNVELSETQPTVESAPPKEESPKPANDAPPVPLTATHSQPKQSVPPSEQVRVTTATEEPPSHSLHVGFLIGLIAAIVVGLLFFIVGGIALQEELGPEAYLAGFITGYFFFSFIILLGHDALPAELFLDCLFKSVNVPGVIFTLDLDGILFLIFYKFILAPLVTVVVWLFFVIGGFLLSLVMSAFMFPFYIPRIFRETFRGGRVRPKKVRKINHKAEKNV